MINISKREIITIIAVSIGFLLMPFIFTPNIDEQQNYFSSNQFLRVLSENILLIGFFILNYFFFTTKLYFKKKYVVYILVLLVSFFFIYKIPEMIFPFERIGGKGPRGIGKFGPRKPPLFIIWSPKVLMFACVSFITVIFRQSIRYQEVKEEKQLSEIAYLRAQINPHFLFNTLNSIYALTLQKSDNASDAVMKLSKMMRYVVSDSSKDLVPLQQDLDYIKNYIQLQQLRIVNKDSIHFTMSGNFSQLMISPLLLINFIENAFKYGIVDEVENPIIIDINVIEGQLELKVVNTISGNELMESEKSETGISNTKKRLNYLYGDRYELNIKEVNQQFSVNLKMDLND